MLSNNSRFLVKKEINLRIHIVFLFKAVDCKIVDCTYLESIIKLCKELSTLQSSYILRMPQNLKINLPISADITD